MLQIAASIDKLYNWVIVVGNLENDPWETIERYLKTNTYDYFACSVMPCPQLKQAITYSKKIKQKYPHITIIWGGYFASYQHKVCLNLGYVD